MNDMRKLMEAVKPLYEYTIDHENHRGPLPHQLRQASPLNVTEYFLSLDFTRMPKYFAAATLFDILDDTVKGYDQHGPEEPWKWAMDKLWDGLSQETTDTFDYDEDGYGDDETFELSDRDYHRLPRLQSIVKREYQKIQKEPWFTNTSVDEAIGEAQGGHIGDITEEFMDKYSQLLEALENHDPQAATEFYTRMDPVTKMLDKILGDMYN